jgi:hypothetical protein
LCNNEIIKDVAIELIHIAQDFNNEIEAYMMDLNEHKVQEIRNKFNLIL